MVVNYVGERIAKLEERMETVEEQLGNFKDFRRMVQEFVTRSDERALHRAEQEKREKEEQEKKDQRRAKTHYWWLALLSGVILTLLSYVLNWTHDFEKRHHVSETSIQQPTSTHAKEE